MRHDNRTIRGTSFLDGHAVRHLARRQNLVLAHVVCWAIALSVVMPAAAEFQLADSNNLADIEALLGQTKTGVDIVNEHLDDIEFELTDLDLYLQDINNTMTAYLPGLLTATQGIEDQTNLIRAQVDYLAEIAANAEYNIYLIETSTANILDLLGQLVTNTDAGTTPGTSVFTPGELITPAITTPGWLFPAVDPQNLPGILTTDPTFIDLDDPTPDELDVFEWTPPTKTGKQVFSTSINLGPLASFFGSSGGIINLETDLSWYEGTIRNAVYAAMLGMTAIACGWLIFQEFKRMA